MSMPMKMAPITRLVTDYLLPDLPAEIPDTIEAGIAAIIKRAWEK